MLVHMLILLEGDIIGVIKSSYNWTIIQWQSNEFIMCLIIK